MNVCGKEIKDECQYCGERLQCELFRQGHGIRQERSHITDMIKCQFGHEEKRLNKGRQFYGEKQ